MIIPAILENDIETIKKEVKAVEQVAKLIQIDISDGTLVDQKTFLDLQQIDEIQTQTKFEIHLMVQDPSKYINGKLKKISRVIAHIETQGLEDFIEKARSFGYEVGLSINPETPIEKLAPFIDLVDYIQFMTVDPGIQGGKFIPEILDKINIFKITAPRVVIQVDGGIDEASLPLVVQAGATNVVVGSQIYQEPEESYTHFEHQLQEAEAEEKHTKENEKIKRIAFLGGAGVKPEDDEYKGAFEVAKILAKSGHEIVNGGGPGIMEASTKGAHAGGGEALAVTYYPRYKHKNYEGVCLTNDYDQEVVTLDYFDRTKVMLQNSDVHIVFRGGTGTISEFGMTWASSRIHEGHHKPIILYGDFWNHIITEFQKHMKMREGELELVKIVKTPNEVLDYIEQLTKS